MLNHKILLVHKQKFQTIFLIFHNFKQEPKQKLTQEQIEYRSNLIIKEYTKQYEIEKFYSQESNQELKLQGYDFFEKNQIFITGRNTNVSGSVQDDYILNIGDELNFVFQVEEMKFLVSLLKRWIFIFGLYKSNFSTRSNFRRD